MRPKKRNLTERTRERDMEQDISLPLMNSPSGVEIKLEQTTDTLKDGKIKLQVDMELMVDKDIITFCIADKQFYAPRALIVHHSKYLAQQLDTENVILFTEFNDVPEMFELGLEVLKGVEITIDLSNFSGLLKFSVVCKAEKMYDTMLKWLKVEYEENRMMFMDMFDLCKFLMDIDKERNEIRELCCWQLETRGLFIIEAELSYLVEKDVKNELIELLVNPRYIWTTLELIIKLVCDRQKAEYVLDLINTHEILSTLRYNILFTIDFLSKLQELLVESSKKHLLTLLKIQSKLLQTGSVTKYHIPPILTSEEFFGSPERRAACLALTPEKLLELKSRLNLQDVVYCELVADWFKARRHDRSKKRDFVRRVWAKIDFSNVSKGFVYELKASLDKWCPNEKLQLELPSRHHNFLGYGFYLTEHQTYSLRLGHPVTLNHHCAVFDCKETTHHGLCFQLTDATPCYAPAPVIFSPKCHYHAQSLHWWLSHDGREIVSLITHSKDEIVKLLEKVTKVYVCCMGPMSDNPVVRPASGSGTLGDTRYLSSSSPELVLS